MIQITLDDFIIESNPWTYMRQMFTPAPLMLTENAAKTARILAFEDRKQARVDRLSQAATKRRTEANRRFNAGFAKLDAIPFGQPIHGVKDRNYRDKARAQVDSSMKYYKEADNLERRAQAAANNKSISSDDPQAIEKLTKKLDGLQAAQDLMKRINIYYRKHGSLDGCNEDATALEAAKDNLKYSMYHVPFPPYSLSNNNAEIHRLRDRIKELQAMQTEESEVYAGDGWTAEEDTADNRIRIYFDDKPDDKTRSLLKSNGFRWSPKAGAWQRQITTAGRSAMRRLAAQLN